MIRFIAVCTFVILFLVIGSPLLVITWLIGLKNPDAKSRISLSIVNWAFRVVRVLAGTKVTIIGLENIPKDEPVLYVGNHTSFFDIVLTYPLVVRPTGYIAKKEMLKAPLLKDWMKHLHCIFLDRDNPKEGLKSILEAIDKIKNGISICIFPEGTRNKTPETLMPFHEGSFKIADKSGCPIIPMTLVNSSAVFEDQFPKIRKAHVIIEYGKPIYLNELTKEERKKIGSKVQGIIAETYDKNRQNLFTFLSK